MKKTFNGKAHKKLSPDELDIVTGGGSHEVDVDGEKYTIYVPDINEMGSGAGELIPHLPQAKSYKGGYVRKNTKQK